MNDWTKKLGIVFNVRRWTAVWLLAGLLVFSCALRWNTFWLSHWKGDQNHYIVLAMKLDSLGLKGYNLRETVVKVLNVASDPPMQFYFVKLGRPGEEGDILRSLKMFGQGYLDEPLHVRAPLLPYLLMFSHHLFAPKETGNLYGACTSNLGKKVFKEKPSMIFKVQFWAVVVPLFFNLALIALVFFMGYRFFNRRVGFYSALLLSLDPASLFLAHKLLTEDVAAFFGVLSVFLYFVSFGEKRNLLGICVSGASMGLAVLAKQTSGFGILAVWLYTLFVCWEDKENLKSLLKAAARFEFIIYVLSFLAVSAFWFARVQATYGTPFHAPDLSAGVAVDITGWFQTLRRRPNPGLFFIFSTVFLCPLFFFALFSFKAFCGLIRVRPETAPGRSLLFCWLWIVVFYAHLARPWQFFGQTGNSEHRYFYMAHPLICVLAAWALDKLRERLTRWIRPGWVPDAALLALFCLNAWWTVPQTMNLVFKNSMLL